MDGQKPKNYGRVMTESPMPVEALRVTLKPDIQPMNQALAALAEALERRPEITNRFIDLLEPLEELFTVRSDDSFTPGTTELIVRLEPTDRFFSLMAAIRAQYPDLGLVE